MKMVMRFHDEIKETLQYFYIKEYLPTHRIYNLYCSFSKLQFFKNADSSQYLFIFMFQIMAKRIVYKRDLVYDAPELNIYSKTIV